MQKTASMFLDHHPGNTHTETRCSKGLVQNIGPKESVKDKVLLSLRKFDGFVSYQKSELSPSLLTAQNDLCFQRGIFKDMIQQDFQNPFYSGLIYP